MFPMFMFIAGLIVGLVVGFVCGVILIAFLTGGESPDGGL
jgi:hypothetical protein